MPRMTHHFLCLSSRLKTYIFINHFHHFHHVVFTWHHCLSYSLTVYFYSHSAHYFTPCMCRLCLCLCADCFFFSFCIVYIMFYVFVISLLRVRLTRLIKRLLDLTWLDLTFSAGRPTPVPLRIDQLFVGFSITWVFCSIFVVLLLVTFTVRYIAIRRVCWLPS